jgi:hypothetical protein
MNVGGSRRNREARKIPGRKRSSSKFKSVVDNGKKHNERSSHKYTQAKHMEITGAWSMETKNSMAMEHLCLDKQPIIPTKPYPVLTNQQCDPFLAPRMLREQRLELLLVQALALTLHSQNMTSPPSIATMKMKIPALFHPSVLPMVLLVLSMELTMAHTWMILLIVVVRLVWLTASSPTCHRLMIFPMILMRKIIPTFLASPSIKLGRLSAIPY